MDKEEQYNKIVNKFSTSDVENGKLTGTTDTDYFYFLCPKCDNGGSHIMRILNFGQLKEREFRYKELKLKSNTFMQFCFELYCPNCKLHTVVKLSNEGRQGGKITDEPLAMAHRVIGPNEKI